MKKFASLIIVFLLVAFLAPSFVVHAESMTVNTEDELKNALQNESIDTILLGKDIDTTEKINITRPVTIDGQGHTMKYTGTFKDGADFKTWAGIYLLQVYKTSATIKDIKLTGGNAGLLVNGSTVRLEGKIDVSGNGFGGIELSQGKEVDDIVKVILDDNAEIVNTTEEAGRPTLWVPSDSDDAYIEQNGETATILSGEELTLIEVLDLLPGESTPTPSATPQPSTEVENPSTADRLSIYIGLGLLGLLGLGFTRKIDIEKGL